MLHPTRPTRLTGAATLLAAIVLLTWPLAWAQPDPPRGDLRIAVLGDFNGPYGSLSYPPQLGRAVDAITGVWRPDLLLSPGDVVAGQDRELPDDRFPAMWAAFDEALAAPLREAGIPYAVALGNHDGSSLRGRDGRYLFQRERDAAAAYWDDPVHRDGLRLGAGNDPPFDWSFTYGGAGRGAEPATLFVLVWDASSAELGEARLAWAERQLASPAARGARWRIVLGHLPLYPVARGRDRPGETLRDPERVRALLERGGVDLAISGHHAAYFPGRVGGLRLLHAGGIGARPLLAGDAPPRSTVTLIDLDAASGALRLTTFDLRDFAGVDPAELPGAIASVAGTVRLDAGGAPHGEPDRGRAP